MKNLKTKGFITLVFAIVLIFCANLNVFAADDPRIKSFNLTANFNGTAITDGQTINIKNTDSKRKVNITVDPEYVDSSLKIYYTFSGHTPNDENGRGILATGKKTASYSIPTDLVEGGVYTMNMEAVINDNADQYWAKSNVVTVKFYCEQSIKPEIAVYLYDGSKEISNGSTIEKQVGDKLTLKAKSNVDVEFVAYIWDLDKNTKKTVNAANATITVPNMTAGTTKRLDIQGKLVDPTGTMTDAEKYSASKTFYIKAVEAPAETITVSLAVDGKYIVASNKVENGTFDHYVYHWDSAAAANTTANQFTIPEVPGTYTLYVKGVTKNGVVSKEVSKKVTIAAPEETITVSLAVNGKYIVASNKVENGTFDHYVYHWDSAAAANTTVNQFTIPEVPGTYTLYVKGVTKSGLVSKEVSKKVTIAAEEAITVSLTVDGKYVVASNKVENGTFDHYVYHWDSAAAANTTANKFTIPEVPGTYTLYVKGVTKSGLVSKEVSKKITIEAPATETITVTLTVNGKYIVASNKVENGTFDHYVYHWDNAAAANTTANQFTIPEQPGTYTLYVKGVTKSGLVSKEVSKKVTIEAPVVEKITVTLTVDGKYVVASNKVENGTFDHYVYHWDSAAAANTTTNKFTIPEQPGTYTLYVKGVTKNGVESPEVSKKVTVEEPVVITGDVDAKIDGKTLSNGSTRVVAGNEKINLVGNPKANISAIKYAWDNGAEKTINAAEGTIDMVAKAGETHTLKVYGVLTDGKNTTSKTYKFTMDGNPDEGGELDIDPWMKKNEDAEGLIVALRNGSDEDKANKNFYMVGEEVIYYVDYMNAGKEIKDEVKLVLNLPLDFTVVDTDGGVADKSKKTITWTYPYGLVENAEDTKVVRIKYTALSKKSYKSEMIYPQAVIYKKAKAQDYSAVINCIYLDEDTEFSDTHVPYMYGDLEAPTFRPDEGISRAEGAMVLLRIFDENYLNVKTITDKYSDIEDTYYVARQAITKATQLGIMSGYPDGTFRPNDKMTRAEFMRVIASYIEESAEIKGLEIKDSTAVTIYKNSKNKNHWSNPYVTLLARLNMTSASNKEKDLRVEDTITRAEVAQLCNYFLFRAPAKVTSSTRIDFTDVSRSHKLVADIVEATRDTHSYTVSEEGKEIASK